MADGVGSDRASVSPKEAGAVRARRGSLLIGLVRASFARVAGLAALDFAWFMALPLLVALAVDAGTLTVLPVVFGTAVEVVRLFARQKVRRRLRRAFMAEAARQALDKQAAIPEVRADAAFWGAHIAEYAVSLDVPAVVGAALAAVVTLALAASRVGFGAIAQVGLVLLGGVLLGVLSSRLRRQGVDRIVDERQETAVWMAAAARDNGELASPRASARFVDRLAFVTAGWCAAEEAVERARTRHRLAIAGLGGAALYVVARLHGIDLLRGVPEHAVRSESLFGALLLGSCLPAAYAFASHLESLSVANSELTRLALGVASRARSAEVRLASRPMRLHARAVSVRHELALALDLGDLELSLERPLAIAGANGSGKTTLASVIAGIRRPSTGALALDGTAASDVNRDDIAFVPQDPVLIDSLTVGDNLSLVAASFEPPEAQRILRSLGLDSALTKRAGNLSRGEQRRIAIARALLKQPKLLVLDEPDAWLDVEGRAHLLRALEDAAERVSIVVVSHRPDVLARFDTVLVLDENHRVQAVDHPSQLRAASPVFRALFEGPGDGASPEPAVSMPQPSARLRQ